MSCKFQGCCQLGGELGKHGLANIFHISDWKTWPGQLFPQIPEEVLEITRTVEKIGQANICHDSGLENVAMLIFPFFSTNS